MFLDDVKIVQQPIARRADVEPRFRPVAELAKNSAENRACVFEPEKQRTRPAPFLRRQKPVLARDDSCSLTQPFSSEDLSADGADELFSRPIFGAAEKTFQECCTGLRREYACHDC